MASCWSPAQYDRFAAERAQPFFDRLDLVEPAPDMRMLDLGCGTGKLTAQLHQRLGVTETLAIDRSAEMLARAEPHPGITFRQLGIEELTVTEPYDLVFTNAALQWLDDHPPLFQRIWSWVRLGGQLAVQMPANHDHPSHVLAAELAGEAPFRDALGGHTRVSPVLPPERYATLLQQLEASAQQVRLQVYLHLLDSRDDVIEWVRGTLLTDYQRRMPAELFESFLAQYTERLLPVLDDLRPYPYPFKRLLLWARR